jgi:hypothetical protein
MHMWGDEGVDWKGINEAAEYIGKTLAKYARIQVAQYKEKFGTVRVYCSFGWYQLHDITHPEYHYNQYPKWLWNIDCLFFSKLIKLINPIVCKIHKWYYKRTYRKAVEKWPHLKKEILYGADYTNLLREEFTDEEDWSGIEIL